MDIKVCGQQVGGSRSLGSVCQPDSCPLRPPHGEGKQQQLLALVLTLTQPSSLSLLLSLLLLLLHDQKFSVHLRQQPRFSGPR